MIDLILSDYQLIRMTYPLIINDHLSRLVRFRNSSFKWVIISVANPTNFIGILMIKFFKVSWYPTLENVMSVCSFYFMSMNQILLYPIGINNMYNLHSNDAINTFCVKIKPHLCLSNAHTIPPKCVSF